MLLVYGSDDGLGPLPNVVSLREELGEQVELAEIRDAGHFLQIEKPQVVAAAVLSWLRRQDVTQLPFRNPAWPRSRSTSTSIHLRWSRRRKGIAGESKFFRRTGWALSH